MFERFTDNARNLVVRAMRTTFARLGSKPRGLEVVCANRIPHSRGLGSSAAAIVAGVLAARSLVLGGLDDDEVYALCVSLEGHPDNVAACLRGGLTLAWSSGVVSLPLAVESVVAYVANTKSSTSKARRMLPESVPHSDAVQQAARAALLVEALGRRPDLLMDATEDRLHQPYRAEGMPRTAALVAALRDKGVPAVVSGAGPTVLALGETDVPAPRGFTAIPLTVDSDGAQVLAV